MTCTVFNLRIHKYMPEYTHRPASSSPLRESEQGVNMHLRADRRSDGQSEIRLNAALI